MHRLLLVLVLAGCYEPTYQQCVVRCEAASDCAPEQICNGEGWCVAADSTARCEPASGLVIAVDVDVAVLPDASVGDAPPNPTDAPPTPACTNASCSGTCIAGTCVIHCYGKKSCDTVQCPAAGPCRVECVGKESCRERIYCGTGRCTVLCTGEESCEGGVECGSACACDVTCTGEDACDEPSTCPSPACRLGLGCTPFGASCAAC